MMKIYWVKRIGAFLLIAILLGSTLMIPISNAFKIPINKDHTTKQIEKQSLGYGYDIIEFAPMEGMFKSSVPNTVYISKEEVFFAGEQNDIGYNVDAGNSLHRSLSLYIGEPIEQTIPGRGRIGTLEPSNGDKEDWYRFTICKGQTIQVSLISDENYDVEILDVEETSFGQSYTADEAGWYFIHVHANDGAGVGDYTISVSCSGQNDANTGNDAGDDFETATSISTGSYIGYMDYTDVEDWYSFTVNTSDGIFVKVKPIEDSDYDVFLYNPLGELVHSAQYYGEDELEYPADITGTWTIKLDMFPGWDTSKWPEDYFLYGSGVYTLELKLGGMAEKPLIAQPQPDIIPVSQTFIINDDPTSNKDEYGYLAAVPAANYLKGGERYVSPIVYQGVDTVTNWFGTVDDTTQYLLDDWETYLLRHGIEPSEYVIEADPVQAAVEIASSRWVSSDTAVVVVDGSDFKDEVQTVFDEDAMLNANKDVIRVSSSSSEFKEIGGLFAVPMYINSKWGAIAVHGLGRDFSGEIGIITPKYESLGDDWWPHPYDGNGPDTDVYHPITIPGIWMPYTDSMSGLDEMEIIKIAGDRYKIPIETTDCSLKVTVKTDDPSYLRIYLVDPKGNVRRPMVPHWNGGPINPIHIWNGGHWEGIGFDDWRFWEPTLSTVHSVEIHYPMTGKWTAVVVPGSVDVAGGSFSYHVTAEMRMHSNERVASALSAANGAVIASLEHAPLLYVKEDSVPSETKNALISLGVTKVIFVEIDNIGSQVKSELNEYTLTDLTTMQQVIDNIGTNSENFITITSFGTGDGYFAPAAMIAAYHGSPVLSIGEAAEAYNTLDMIAAWREYAGDYYHGCRSVGHLPEMDHPFDFGEFIKGILQGEFPAPGFDLKKRWFCGVYDGIHEFINGYGLDEPGKEAYMFVAPRDTDIRDPICRAMTGNNSYAGHIPVESPAFSSAVICRDILYPAIIYSNPGRNVTSSCLMHFCDPYPWTTNDGQVHQSVLSREMKESGFSHGRFYEGHSIWENLLERYNTGASFIYHDSHGTGGSGIASMYKNVAEQFPLAELRHEHLKDFDWWDGWRGYYYDNQQTCTPRTGGGTFFNAQEPNLYDPIHFKYCDQLFENLHSQFNLWMSCTTGEHFGPIIYLEHGAAIWYGNSGTGSNPQCELLDYWMFEGVLEDGLSIGESLSNVIWLLQRDFTTGDPTAMYGVSSLGRTNVHVIFGDPTMRIYNPGWTEPVPVDG